MPEAFNLAYCPPCDVVVPLELIRVHNLESHEGKWLTLTWSSPLEFPDTRGGTIADQLDRASYIVD